MHVLREFCNSKLVLGLHRESAEISSIFDQIYTRDTQMKISELHKRSAKRGRRELHERLVPRRLDRLHGVRVWHHFWVAIFGKIS